MAYVSVCEWTSDHVVDWLRGLDNAIAPYIAAFQNNDINGRHLLLITPNDLYNLNVTKVGHQELILEAVDLLRQLNYNVDSENLQSIALKLGCKARSLCNELKQYAKDGQKRDRVNTATLSAVSGVLSTVKTMVSWLDRNPFDGQDQYVPIRKTILKLSIELASTAQRDQFAENPHDVIKNSASNLAELCDKVVQELNDPLIIQPAFIDVAIIRKEPTEELGIHVQSSYSGIHIVGGVKFQSPAHQCSKISQGDEIIQVNYQTVVGWKLDKLVELLRDPVNEVTISLKRRPRHTETMCQVIVLKPWRLPLKKKKSPKRSDTNSPIESSKNKRRSRNSDKDNCAIISEREKFIANARVPQSIESNDNQKPKATIKRRVTVSGASPTVSRPPVRIEDLVPQNRTRDGMKRCVSHNPSSNDNMLSAAQTPNLQTIESHEDEMNLNNCNERPTKMASMSDINQSSQSSVIKLRTQGMMIPHSEDEECVSLADKNILETIRNCDYGISSSDARSTNADTGFVSLSESSDSMCDRSSQTRSSPSLDTMSTGSSGSAFLSPDYKPKSSYTTQDHPSNEQHSYQVSVIGGVPHKLPSPEVHHRSPNLRNKQHRSRLASRRISCKDLGQGDCQGWLYKRKVHKSILLANNWQKRWFVLKNLNLYCYKDVNDETAESLIYLPGFNVSPAPECKSKKYSFKAYHTGTTFYFATESQQDLSKWMNKMGLAAISYDASALITTSGFLKPEANLSIGNMYYSETEDEDRSCENSREPSPCSPKNEAHPYMNMSSIRSHVNGKSPTNPPTENPSKSETQSPYMNVPLLQNRTERLSSASSSTSTLNRPIPAKRNAASVNRSHTYMNIPKTSPSYKLSLQQKMAKVKLSQESNSELSPKAETVKSSSLLNLNTSGPTQPETHSHPYMNIPNMHPSHIASLPDTKTRRNEFFGVLTDRYPPVNYKSRFADKISASSTHLDRSGYDSSSRASSLDRKEMRDISPGLVARLTGSYNRLDNQEVLDLTPTSMSAVLSGKLKRRELSPGRVARITGSFDSLGRDKARNRQYSTSSMSSTSSTTSANRGRLAYQRSLSASHPAVCELSDIENYDNNVALRGSCENLQRNNALNQVPVQNNQSHVTPAENGNRRYKTPNSAPVDYRRYMSVPEGATEFINGYNAHTNNQIPAQKYVSLVDREHKRLYGPSLNEELLQNSSVPKSATSQQIQEIYSKMAYERSPLKYQHDSSPEHVFSSSVSSEEYVTPMTSPGEMVSRQQTQPSLSSLNVPPPPPTDPPSQGYPAQTSIMQPQYVQSPGTVFTPISVPPLNVSPKSKAPIYPSDSLNYIQMGYVPTTACKPPLVSSSIKNGAHPVGPLKISRVPSRESSEPSTPTSSANFQEEKPAKGLQKFFSSPRFSKKHLRAKSPVPEKKLHKLRKSSTDSLGSSVMPDGGSDRKFVASPRLGRTFFGSPKVTRKHDFEPAAHVDEILLPTRTDNLNRSDSCSSLSSLNSTSTSASSQKHLPSSDIKKRQLSIHVPPIGESSTDEAPRSPGTPRTPVPSMGISVVMGKKRCSTPSSGESSCRSNNYRSLTPVSSPQGFTFSPENKLNDHDVEDELVVMAKRLRKAKLTPDGANISERRRQTMLQPCVGRRQSKRVLELRALERTLKSKEIDLKILDDLLNSPITSELLDTWVENYSHLLPSDFEDSD